MGKVRSSAAIAALVLGLGSLPAQAIHFYRGPGGGCTPATGELTDDPTPPSGPVAATVKMLHNSYHDDETGGPVTFIEPGQAVRFTWNSAHCHSADSAGTFASGFHYPTTAPTSAQALPGVFDYPIPEETATLAFTHTFPTAGTFTYSCVHHAAIGMTGVVVVG